MRPLNNSAGAILAGFIPPVKLLPIRKYCAVVFPLTLAVLCAMQGLADEASESAPAGCYRVYQSIQVNSNIERFEGHIQLLQDHRVVGPIREERWGCHDDMWCFEGTPLKDFCASIRKEPLLPAMVRLVCTGGFVSDRHTMGRELASMTAHHLYGDEKQSYLITVDHSIGMGSYGGPTTRLAEVRAGRLAWLKALDANDGKEDEIVLTKSLKNVWNLVPRSDGKGQDILKVACRLASSNRIEQTGEDFDVIYTRFHFDGYRWMRFERTEPGYFDDEGEFPRRDEFP